MKHFFNELKSDLSKPSFYVAVVVAIIVVGVINGFARKYLPMVATVEDKISSTFTPTV